MTTKCPHKTEVYARVCGFFRPVQQWNKGKRAEFAERRTYAIVAALAQAGKGVARG